MLQWAELTIFEINVRGAGGRTEKKEKDKFPNLPVIQPELRANGTRAFQLFDNWTVGERSFL